MESSAGNLGDFFFSLDVFFLVRFQMRLEQQLLSANNLQQCLEKQLERLRMEAAQTDSQSHMVFSYLVVHLNNCSCKSI